MLIAAADPVLDAQEAARAAVQWIETAVGDRSATEWVLLIVAGAALVWVYLNLRALTRLGPIDVELLQDDGNPSARVKGLTATFREALARTGLIPPPAVPAGTPQVNLLAAVEASNISQAAWVAKVLAMLPRPRPHQYKITGTLQVGGARRRRNARLVQRLTGRFPTPGSGVSIWVRPASEGREMLRTFGDEDTHEDALKRAASEIYLHISNNAVEAFPLWARWRDAEALAAYREGCRLRADGQLDQALREFQRAADRERFNKLADLQLANIYEQQAQNQATDVQVALAQAFALRRYLDILEDANTIVEAHYRTSLVAGVLATRCDEVRAAVPGVRRELALKGAPPDDEGFIDALKALAKSENRAVAQMLGPLYAVFNGLRLRTQFEPRGHERRQLKHTAAISKHCVRVRKLVLDDATPWTRALELRWRIFAVHVLHLVMGQGNLSWQARYNAACFDALLLARERHLAGESVGDVEEPT